MNIVALDFHAKVEKSVSWQDLATNGPEIDLFYWIDLDRQDEPVARDIMSCFKVNPDAMVEALGPDRDGRHDVYDDCLHASLTEARLDEDGRLGTSHVDILLGGNYMILWHRTPARCVDQMRRTYREDFKRFAKTPGFLLYELGDHLIESYRRICAHFASEVERVQLNLFGTVDDNIFRHVSTLTTDLLSLKKMIQAARELLHQLSSRRSPFISESTQSFLERMAGTLERMSSDLTSEREVLSETLNLYMGMVSHRTNRIINRLTVISMIFLPLTFVCGVYGMNFDVMPELRWPHSYMVFWGICLLFASVSIYSMRRKRWL